MIKAIPTTRTVTTKITIPRSRLRSLMCVDAVYDGMP